VAAVELSIRLGEGEAGEVVGAGESLEAFLGAALRVAKVVVLYLVHGREGPLVSLEDLPDLRLAAGRFPGAIGDIRRRQVRILPVHVFTGELEPLLGVRIGLRDFLEELLGGLTDHADQLSLEVGEGGLSARVALPGGGAGPLRKLLREITRGVGIDLPRALPPLDEFL